MKTVGTAVLDIVDDESGPAFAPLPPEALDGSVGDCFAGAVRRFPDRLAVSDTRTALTYAELAARARHIAAATVAAAGERDGPVAILLGREVRVVAAMLGVLAAGRGFVPLDTGNPIARNRDIAARSGAVAVVSCGRLPTGEGLFAPDLPVVDLDRLEDAPAAAELPRPGPGDLACIVYTSGSTGTPKGAAHDHRNLVHDATQQIEALQATPDDRLALVYSPTVIGAVREILVALFSGASIHILPPSELLPAGLVREARRRRITILRLVPPLLRQIADALPSGERLDSVRIFGLGSQRVDWADVDIFRRAARQDARLIVGIGATECGGNFAHWFVDERLRGDGGLLPVGRVLPDAAVSIVGDDGREVADGAVGEFVVASRHVARGYWRDPEETARVFAADPDDPSLRHYRTGDFGRRRPDGLLEFVGRRDDQIKLRGHRIETAEIEAALRAIPSVRDVAIVIRRGETGMPRALIGYAEGEPDTEAPRSHELRRRLAQRLPGYMVPAAVVMLPKLPRLANLKIDRARLAALDGERSGAPGGENDPLADELAALFGSVIGVADATPDDNVASLGGDSLQAVILAVMVERRFALRLPVGIFERSETIRDLARWIARHLPPEPGVNERRLA